MNIHLPDLFELAARTVSEWGYWVVFILVFLETSAFVGLLVPGETILIASGAVAAQGRLDVYDLMVLAVIAAFLGDNAGYWLGRWLGRDFLVRHRSLTRVRQHHLDRADRYFERLGGLTIFIGRWIGFLRTFGPFLAGSARMPYPKFLAYDVGGASSWAIIGVLAGYLFGKSYGLIERWLGRITLFLLILAVAAVILWLLGRYLRRRREQLAHIGYLLTDAIIESRLVLAIRRRFDTQLKWIFRRFSPSRAYGLGLTLGMAVFVTLAWLLGAITELVLERGPVPAIDRSALIALHERAIPQMTELMVYVSYLGQPRWVLAAAVVVSLLLVFLRRYPEALVLFSATGGAVLLTVVLKYMMERPRPAFVEPLVQEAGYAFPSGHAAAAVAFYVTLGLLATGWVRHWESRMYALVAATGLAFLIGFSRVYLGVHYPSDVMAGYAVGALWTTLTVTAATVWARAREESGRPVGRRPLLPGLHRRSPEAPSGEGGTGED